ncbi:MAG: bZIP transcription factor [Crocinitomicaceae bacterium]|nr:bZIP transcription factor [Crocinitomicaceae bacterium]
MKVDSNLLVKDSLRVQKDMRTEGDFRVEGEAYFFNKVYMFDDLLVDGGVEISANLQAGNNVKVDNKLTVSGKSTFDDNVKMSGLDYIPNINNPNIELLAKLPSGELYKVDIPDLITLMYSKDCQGNIQDIASPAWNNGLNKIFVNYSCANVKVGIRTSDPQYFLDVREMAHLDRLKVGAIPANEDGMINGFDITNSRDLIQLGVLNATTQNQSDVRFRVSNKGAIYSKNLGSDPSLVLHNGTGQAIIVFGSNGSKLLQLDNNGMLRTREIKVDLDAWPDYVFDEDYQLLTLDELSSYINRNGHLPGLPSAYEIEENGLNLGEIQKMQMEKIEEQSLYTLQLNDRISDLETENEQLKSELEELKIQMNEIREMFKE